MSPTTATIPPAKALPLHALITPTEQGIASRVLARTAGAISRSSPSTRGRDLLNTRRRSTRSCWSSKVPSP